MEAVAAGTATVEARMILETRAGFSFANYGMTKWSDLFTSRQLVALTTFSDLVQEARTAVTARCLAAGLANDGKPLNAGGTGARHTQMRWECILRLLLIDALTRRILCTALGTDNQEVIATFSRQAIANDLGLPE